MIGIGGDRGAAARRGWPLNGRQRLPLGEALAELELLFGAGDAAPAYLEVINRSKYFRIEPFATMPTILCLGASFHNHCSWLS
jgi:hypothetical protein